ncbi:cytochrome C oxidase subunit IV family protein [Chloroflexus sp. Y-396-1]|uniref:cytochrome C oxidase subunit IV family protein n=1 Tax=Chloroflexus sp. Y-396-1 TaxID=867845 RepID=UPI00048C8443|nr:cytochrome C oxidase subunit IV family protein [Chloroflexus sp. Y-396-1]
MGEKHAHHTTHHHSAGHAHISRGTYYRVFAALMVLMVLTVAAWWVEKNLISMPGWLAVTIAMSIAVAKTALIVIYFMHVKVSSRITQVYAVGAFVWLIILFVITMGDYVARGWPPQAGPLP